MPFPQNLAQIFGRSMRAKPPPAIDQVENVPDRRSRYQEAYVQAIVGSKHVLADEGSYFVATNPTPGTGVAYALQTAFSDTAALFAIQNTATDGRRIYMDYLRLMLTAAPTATVSLELAVKLDAKDRSPSAGNVAITPVNPNGDDASASAANVQAFSAAALTVPTSGAKARQACRARICTSLGIVGDQYKFRFGAQDEGGAIPGLTAARATAVASLVDTCPPLIIAPGAWAVFYLWWLTAATTAPSFEYELGWWER